MVLYCNSYFTSSPFCNSDLYAYAFFASLRRVVYFVFYVTVLVCDFDIGIVVQYCNAGLYPVLAFQINCIVIIFDDAGSFAGVIFYYDFSGLFDYFISLLRLGLLLGLCVSFLLRYRVVMVLGSLFLFRSFHLVSHIFYRGL